jgi:hypothetical protein
MLERIAVIFNTFSHKPLDVRGGITAPGAVIQQFNYNGGANQRWIVRDAGQGPIGNGPAARRFFLSTLGQAMTVDPADPNHVRVSQQPLAPNATFAAAAGQLWALEELPRSDPFDPRRYLIRDARDGRVLGLQSENNTDGIEVELGDYQNKDSQWWEILYQLNLQTLGNTDIMVIFSKHSHKCLDVPGLTLNDADIQQFTYNGGRNQFWSLAPASAQLFPRPSRPVWMILPVHASGLRALDLKEPLFRQVVQRTISSVNRQAWTIFHYPPLYPGFPVSSDFMIDNAISLFSQYQGSTSGLVLDVVNGTTNDGDTIQIHAPHFGPNQLWEIWVSEAYPEGFTFPR